MVEKKEPRTASPQQIWAAWPPGWSLKATTLGRRLKTEPVSSCLCVCACECKRVYSHACVYVSVSVYICGYVCVSVWRGVCVCIWGVCGEGVLECLCVERVKALISHLP